MVEVYIHLFSVFTHYAEEPKKKSFFFVYESEMFQRQNFSAQFISWKSLFLLQQKSANEFSHISGCDAELI